MYILSIITPIFNSYSKMSKYLSWITRNNRDDLQFVFVDDCSRDDSKNSIKSYLERYNIYNYILVSNESNVGPGESRNIGIKYSEGKYITFVDSDDTLSDEFNDIVIPELKHDFDCIVFDYSIEGKDFSKKCSSSFRKKMKDCDFSLDDYLVYIKGSTWGKVYRKSMIIENGIRFLSLKRNEDMPFTKTALYYCQHIKYLNDLYLYKYIQDDTSLMHDASLLDSNNAINAFQSLIIDNVETRSAIFALEVFYSTGLTNSIKMNKKNWKIYVESMKRLFPNLIKNHFLKGFSFRYRFIIFLIYTKQYNFVKRLARMRG